MPVWGTPAAQEIISTAHAEANAAEALHGFAEDLKQRMRVRGLDGFHVVEENDGSVYVGWDKAVSDTAAEVIRQAFKKKWWQFFQKDEVIFDRGVIKENGYTWLRVHLMKRKKNKE